MSDSCSGIKDKGSELDINCINTIRFLAVDAVQKANSGHPGAPMGMATIGYTLWDMIMKHNPGNPLWPDRDRFVLSAGHASMLLYSLLHLTGYDISLDDLKEFRQWDSKTPGHPEFDPSTGVEMSTGPLGQGFAHGVGMAMAERWLASRFNKPGHEIIDHYTYAIVSDGDLQEGLSAEAASFAGYQKLGKMIYLYDDNGIQIEGNTSLCFKEDIPARFNAVGWHVTGPIDGFDIEAVQAAVAEAQAVKDKPSLIICKTVIGYCSPNENTPKVHGAPLGKECVLETKKRLGWPCDMEFFVPDEVREYMGKAIARGADAEKAWQAKFDAYSKEFPELAEKLLDQIDGALPDGWDEGITELFPAGTPGTATRAACGKVMNAIAQKVDNLVGGSADLGPSNKTELSCSGYITPDDPGANNIHFGVREHTMGAVANGMALHGGVIPYTGTFFVFVDYMRPALRLAALMGIRVINVFSHDSIGVGEDGPTHQPVEQLMSLRIIPNMTVIRPADANETAEAWRAALLNEYGPTAIITSRQNLPVFDRSDTGPAHELHFGAYTFMQSGKGTPDAVIIATGSELAIAISAAESLADDGVNIRVVSMPSWELFDKQPQDYKDEVLPPEVTARVSVEAGIADGWEKYTGNAGRVIGMKTFGASGPAGVLFEKFGFTPEAVVKAVKDLLG